MTRPDLILDSDVLIEILRGRPEAGRWLTGLGIQSVLDQRSQTIGAV